MGEARVPVDPSNPGQVFACLGLMEVAEVLVGGVEGGFDWQGNEPCFALSSKDEYNPITKVFEFLFDCTVQVLAPSLPGEWPEGVKKNDTFGSSGLSGPPAFKRISANSLPVLLQSKDHVVPVGHWCDALRENNMKTFAGNQVGSSILVDLLDDMRAMQQVSGLKGEVPSKESFCLGKLNFSEVVVPKSRFGFDARGAWDALHAGLSIDALKYGVAISPSVEVLSAIGLEKARPRISGRNVMYEIWQAMLPISLARVAISGCGSISPGIRFRRFVSHTGPDKYYKKLYFAYEETTA